MSWFISPQWILLILNQPDSKDFFGTELGGGCPSLQTPPGRLTRTLPRANYQQFLRIPRSEQTESEHNATLGKLLLDASLLF